MVSLLVSRWSISLDPGYEKEFNKVVKDMDARMLITLLAYFYVDAYVHYYFAKDHQAGAGFDQ